MKQLLTILSLVLLVSCSNEVNEVPSVRLVERNSITYEVNSETPFTGSSVVFYENGQLRFRENYKDGKLDGLWEWFHENGQLKSRGNLIDGDLEGLYEIFDEDGKLTKTETYKDGELVE